MAKRSRLSDSETEKLHLESGDNFSDSSESFQDTDVEASESDFDSETSDDEALLQQTVPSEFVHDSSVPEQTNLYAEQFIAYHPNLAAHSRVHSWQNTTRDEVKILTGMLVLQGILHKPDHKFYFSKRESVDTPFFRKVMSEKGFHLLLKFLHFADSTSYDPLGTISRKQFEIHPIRERLRRKFRSVYKQERNITVDESLLLWKGQLRWKQLWRCKEPPWKQYIPSKRSRFGIKLREFCESSSGYVGDFIVYTGKDTNYGSHYPDEKITSRIVLELAHDLLGKGHCIYLDNWYTSTDLVDKLTSNNTDVVGTLRQDRKGFLDFVKKEKLKKGEYITGYKGKQMVMTWKDKRDVVMVSTFHDDTFVNVNSKKGIVQKPQVVDDYNKNMEGGDRCDSQLQSYQMAISRLKKHYQKLFRHLLDIVCYNAYILYKMHGGEQSRMSFLISLGEQLTISSPHQETSVGRPPRTPKATRLTARHFPDLLPPTTKKRPTRRCVVCTRKCLRKETSYWCAECEVSLCAAPCFKLFHTENDM
ncbi:piggyBac transposable element-derived protein 4-like [Schistocerca americana]|uniref:piggyBac transposable element-derived protein 4-like n=1 Tax=Schistocerca americana TaxID=7009 RepID=UPI001F503EF2|nr:piggyBac transposable element-derived protein 4-like [Schistocerca americana]